MRSATPAVSRRAAHHRTPSSVGTRTTKIAVSRAAIGGKPRLSTAGANSTKPAVMRAPGARPSARSVGVPSWVVSAGDTADGGVAANVVVVMDLTLA